MRESDVPRRRLLAAVGSGTTLTIAGCAGGGDSDDGAGDDAENGDGDAEDDAEDGDDDEDDENGDDDEGDELDEDARCEGGPSVGTPIETFDEPFLTDEAQWSASLGASMELITDDVYCGDRSVELRQRDDDGEFHGRLDWRPVAPVDLSGRDFSIAFSVPADLDGLAGYVDLRLGDVDGNVLVFRADASSTSVLTESAEWLRIDFGLPNASPDEIDTSRIIEVGIDPWRSAETVRIDDFRAVPNAGEAHLLVDIDNPERKGDETGFLDVFDRWGYPCVMGVDAVYARDEAEVMDVDWLLAAQADGHEVCTKLTGTVVEEAVGVNTADLSELSADQQAEAIAHNRRLLEEFGLDSGLDTVVYTFNNWSAGTREALEGNVRWGRDSGTGACGHLITEPYGLPGHNIDNAAVEDLTWRIDRAVEHGLFLNLYLHPEAVPDDRLDAILEHVHGHVEAGRLEVITHSELTEIVDGMEGADGAD